MSSVMTPASRASSVLAGSPPLYRHGALRWHDLLPLRDLIDAKTRPVNDEYVLIFGQSATIVGGRTCDTGYTEFDERVCWINTECLPKHPATDQFILSVFLAAHERAHARWTDFVAEDFYLLDINGAAVERNGRPVPDLLLHQTWNILEDERIERLLGRDFTHLHPYLRAGSVLFHTLLPPLAETDDPHDVLRWVLRRRVATRAGRTEVCTLTPKNLALLNDIEPLLDEAFSCTSSRRVVEIAREILKRLRLSGGAEDQQVVLVLSCQDGRRGGGDRAESDGASVEESELFMASEDATNELQGNVVVVVEGGGYTPGTWANTRIIPAPYIDLLASVRPFIAPVSRLFKSPPKRPRVEYESSGGRISMRAARRTPATPFRVDGDPEGVGLVALTLVIDDSGSMSGTQEYEGRRSALLCYEALPAPHRVRVVLAPSGRVAADPSYGEINRGYIAGYDSPSGTAYADVLDQELKRLVGLDGRYTKYLLLVADGESSEADQRRCKQIRQRALARRVRMIGIGIGLADSGDAFYKGLFGSHYISLQTANDMVARIDGVLRQISRQVRRHPGLV